LPTAISGGNALALCYSCHEWFGGNPADSGQWLASVLGEGWLDMLREKRDSRVKVSKLEEKDIAKFYRDQYRAAEGNPDHEWESWQ